MCGIAGIFHPETPKPVDPSRIAAMIAAQAHRGPDGDGIWTAPGVGFGQAAAVEHPHPGALRPHQACAFQHLQGDGDGGPAHAEHHRQEFVGDREVVAVLAVVVHRQPAGEPLLGRRAGIGERRLRRLDQEGLGVAQDQQA